METFFFSLFVLIFIFFFGEINSWMRDSPNVCVLMHWILGCLEWLRDLCGKEVSKIIKLLWGCKEL